MVQVIQETQEDHRVVQMVLVLQGVQEGLQVIQQVQLVREVQVLQWNLAIQLVQVGKVLVV